MTIAPASLVTCHFFNRYKTQRGNHRLMISPSHFAVAVASARGQATVTDRLEYILLTWWDGR